MTTGRGDGAAAGRRWVRARRRDGEAAVGMVVFRPDQPELIVVEPAVGLLRVNPDQAVAVAVCLMAAVHGFDHLDPSELMVEADSGNDWVPVVPEEGV
jgi:hypothetical protein